MVILATTIKLQIGNFRFRYSSEVTPNKNNFSEWGINIPEIIETILATFSYIYDYEQFYTPGS